LSKRDARFPEYPDTPALAWQGNYRCLTLWQGIFGFIHHCPLYRCEEWSFDDPNYQLAFMFSIMGLPVLVEFRIVVSLNIILRNYVIHFHEFYEWVKAKLQQALAASVNHFDSDLFPQQCAAFFHPPSRSIEALLYGMSDSGKPLQVWRIEAEKVGSSVVSMTSEYFKSIILTCPLSDLPL
jgi:hypothetical protein